MREAYNRWNELKEIDEALNDNVALLTQGICCFYMATKLLNLCKVI